MKITCAPISISMTKNQRKLGMILHQNIEQINK